MSLSSGAFFLLLPLPSPALAYKAVKTQGAAVSPEFQAACYAMCCSSSSLGIPGTRASNLHPHYVLQCTFLKWTHFTGCFFCFTVPVDTPSSLQHCCLPVWWLILLTAASTSVPPFLQQQIMKT